MPERELQRRLQPYQPFQCPICQSRFTRHENLKRHAALHSRSRDEASISCHFCHATFSRRDLQNRHMKRKHPEYSQEDVSKRKECEPTAPPERQDERVAPDSGEFPPWPIHRLDDLTNHYGKDNPDPEMDPKDSRVHESSPSPDSTGADFNQISPPRSLSESVPDVQDNWTPSTLQVTKGCDLFFSHVSDFVPFIHESTFDPLQTTRHLIDSILCLAYQHGEDPERGGETGSGVTLSIRCYHHARALLAAEERKRICNIASTCTVQSYILLQIYAMMYLCGESSSSALKMHTNMISVVRAAGIMKPTPTLSTTTKDLDDLWNEFIKSETRKRTVFAVHQLDALWYQLLSIPRSVSHLEVKHDLPCPEHHWRASSSTEWAHRRLLSEASGSTVRYADAVRQFLSQDSNSEAISAFDPYGAINITQFLISSSREISGWSTMTGMLSMDRFGALRSSLLALCPFIFPASDARMNSAATLCAATWQTAMIELHLWSPSHTGGIVMSSMDLMLNQSTLLALSRKPFCDTSTAEAIQPHIDWFLRYLNTMELPVSEAPWISIYAYKAFLIAWGLMRDGVPGVMHTVGIEHGDVGGALTWARKVFQRRAKWQLGKVILSCLRELE
ncbi:hypothetical protein BDV59DRAFT_211780 [Aspergillus ambiguus]|uniref:C2H2 finger domain transcription factor n=1 Tax=Aspergillus ambiguus TaxID=176160 RepID=UPI003CCD8678